MWFGIAVVGVLILWTVGSLASLDLLPKNISKHFNTPEKRVAWAVRIFAGLLTVVGIVNYSVIENGILHDFSTEMIGIGVGVLVIDELNRRRSAQEYKRGIIQQMASRSNDFALDAARIAENEGWLQDGSFARTNLESANLAGAALWSANFAGANLESANLAGANLWNANLTRAVLWNANLIGANLESANLAGASLWNANLTRAVLWNANLIGADLAGANLAGVSLWDADLKNARYDDNTQWPKGFDPKSKGAVNSDEQNKERIIEFLKKYSPESL